MFNYYLMNSNTLSGIFAATLKQPTTYPSHLLTDQSVDPRLCFISIIPVYVCICKVLICHHFFRVYHDQKRTNFVEEGETATTSIYPLSTVTILKEEDLETKAGLVEGETARISQFYSLLTSSIDVIRLVCVPVFCVAYVC